MRVLVGTAKGKGISDRVGIFFKRIWKYVWTDSPEVRDAVNSAPSTLAEAAQGILKAPAANTEKTTSESAKLAVEAKDIESQIALRECLTESKLRQEEATANKLELEAEEQAIKNHKARMEAMGQYLDLDVRIARYVEECKAIGVLPLRIHSDNSWHHEEATADTDWTGIESALREGARKALLEKNETEPPQ